MFRNVGLNGSIVRKKLGEGWAEKAESLPWQHFWDFFHLDDNDALKHNFVTIYT
jgi:hypothetical protein